MSSQTTKQQQVNRKWNLWVRAGVVMAAVLGGAVGPAPAQPVNDNFDDATLIAGPSGSVNGTTVNATRELGEPNHWTTTTDPSVWFSWTAPTNGRAIFDTFGSLYDTVLAVYTGDAVSALTVVARNDDFGFGLQSQVEFLATGGVNYRIVVTGFFNSSGFYFLNWQMPDVSTNITVTATNEIQFAFTSFAVAEDTPGYAAIGVNYGGGASGPVTVDYSTADGTALGGIDYLPTFGTLTFEVGESNKTFTVPIIDNAFVNSNKVFTVFLTNVTGGALFGPVTNADVTIIDDESVPIVSTAGEFSFSQPSYLVTEYETVRGPFAPLPYIANRRLVPGALVTVTRTGGSTGRALVDYMVTNNVFTNFFFTNIVIGGVTNTVLITNIVNSAEPGLEYIPTTGTLIFDDFQMSTNIVVPVFGDFIRSNGVRTVAVRLSNPRPAPEENPFVIRPTLGPITNATVGILEIQAYPLFAIERATWRVDEYQDVTGAGPGALIEIVLPPPATRPSVVRCHTVWLFGFLQQAGSDYPDAAEITYVDTPHTDGAVNTPNPQDYEPIDQTVAFGAGQARQRVFIPIYNDTEPEFNEDIYVEILPISGNPGVNPFASDAVVTILYDDQPAGIADRDWNPADVSYTEPPFNLTPGANNSVNATAVQEDGKSIIGGDFTAYNSQPRNRIARLNADGSLDYSFNPGTGADGVVHAVAIYLTSTNAANSNLFGRIVVAGAFTSMNGQQRYSIARLNTDGSLDATFRPGAGANGPIYSVQILESGKIVVGGEFTSFNGIPRNRLARLNADGSLDGTFDPGAGANGTVWAVANEGALPPLLVTNSIFGGGTAEVRTDIETYRNQGQITLTYDFFTIPDSIRVYYEGVRLFDSGFINTPFAPATANFAYGPGRSTILTVVVNEGGNPNPGTAWIYDVKIESTGGSEKVLIGGDFTSFNGVRLNHIARLFANGTVDGSFNPGGGVDGPVYAIASAGAKTYLGGDFHTVDFQNRNFIARLNIDGAVDRDFLPGSGFDAPVYSLALQPDGKIVAGGIFKDFNQTRRVGLARMNTDGSVDTGFMDTAYNQFAGVINPFSFQPRSFIRSIALEPGGNLIVGGSFTNIGGNNSLEVNNRASYSPVWTRQDKATRFNVARVIGGYTRGPGNVEYSFPQYNADENIDTRFVTVRRVNGRVGTAMGLFGTTNSAAIGGLDFVETKTNIIWPEFWYVAPVSVGYVGLQYLDLSIFEDTLVEGDETLILGLDTPTGSITLAGEYIPLGVGQAISRAPMTIVDNDFDHGTLVFETPTFFVNENGTNAVISIIRTNGNNGPVSVTYFVRNGSAVAGVDYTNVLTGTLTFLSGVTNQTFLVPILNDVLVEIDETVSLLLTNATGGAILPDLQPGSTNQATATHQAALVIIDDDFASGRLNFGSLTYATNEAAGLAFITVERLGGNQGLTSVDVVVTNGTAIAGEDFTGFVTNLVWVNGDTEPKRFAVPLIDDLMVELDETVSLTLTDGRVGGALNTNSIGARSAATLTILNEDFFGELAISQPFFDADEDGTNVNITVVRRDGIAGTVQVDYVAGGGTAIDGVDYLGTSGTLVFQPGQISRSFSITLLDDSISDGNKTVELLLTNVVNASLGGGAAALLTLIDDESFNIPAGSLDTSFNTAAGANNAVYQLALQPDGRVLMAGDFTTVNNISRRRLARLFDNGDLDPSFNAGVGPNAPIRAMALQEDGRLLIAGFFTQVHGTNRNYVARLLDDGTVDAFFNPGSGPDNTVYGLALDGDERVVIGGAFNTVNGVSMPGVTVLNTNGSLFTGFNPGLGANGTVFAVAVQPFDGKILIGGDFTLVNNLSRPRVARLLPNGQVDPTFDPGLGADGTVRAIAVQPDGRILVGGSFTHFAGTNRNFLARLEAGGALDQLFLGSLSGGDNAVYGLTLQSDGKILVVGDFTKFNDVTRHRITRLNQNGKTDPTINFGEGANSFIAHAILQPDRRILIGGGFTRVQGEPRNYIARLHGGSIAGPGSLQYSAPFYSVVEDEAEVSVTVLRAGGTTGDVLVDYHTADISASNGVDYVTVSGTLDFPEGEVLRKFTVPVIDDLLVEPDETVRLSLANPAGGALLGVVPEATLTILSDDSVLTFITPTFSVSESAVAGYAPISVLRLGTTNAAISVDFVTFDGTALGGIDYTNVSGTITFAPGETNKTFNVPLIPDSLVEGDETVQLLLTNATANVQFLIPAAALTIVDDDFAPGSLGFDTVTYAVNEYETNVVVTVVRTNGSTGIVSVNFLTLDGTARAPQDYIETSGILTFADGETLKTFNIPIIPDYDPETNETVIVLLVNPTGGARLANNTATLTIINNNLINGSFSFTSTNYLVNESNLVAALTVRRDFGAAGDVSVSFATLDGTALAGTDYVAVTNTLTWTNGEASPKVVPIDLVDDDLVEGIEDFRVFLFNPTGKATLGFITNTTVTVQDDDFGPGNLSLVSASFAVDENGTNAIITVHRTFGSTGTVAIDLGTVSGGTALAGRDYVSTNAALIFTNGVTNATFLVPILDNIVVEGNRTVNLALSNPRNLDDPGSPPSTNGQIIAAVLTILENDPLAGSIDASFSSLDPDGPVNTIWFQTNNSRILVGGDFRSFAGVPRPYVARLTPNGALDNTFDASEVVNYSVYALARQQDGRILVGGAFTNFGPGKVSYLARLEDNGVQDTNFFTGLPGVDNLVYALTVQGDGKVLAGGLFTAVNGQPRQYVARLEANGILDPNFSIGLGPDAAVRAVRVQQDGKAILAGDFTQISGVTRGRIARLNQDGSVDAGFDTSVGADGSIRAMVLQPDGKVIIGGLFTMVNSQVRMRVARLNLDGSLDSTFNPGLGPDEFVNGLALTPTGKIMVVGAFTTFGGVPRARITRLNTDGSVDDTINFGRGANNYINAVAVQTDRKILIGGGFTEFDGQPRRYLARLNGGENIGYGEFVFSAASYNVLETGTNVTVTVRRLVGSSNAVSVAFSTADGTALAGQHYLQTNGVLNFGPGETVATFDVRVLDDANTNADRVINLTLSDPTGGAILGVPSAATIHVINDDAIVGFSSVIYSVSENVGNAVITLERLSSTVGTATVNFTASDGSASDGLDYLGQAGTVTFTNGQRFATFSIPIINDPLVEGNETVNLNLSGAAGAALGLAAATLVIVDDDFSAGLITFSRPTYNVSEQGGFATITVERQGGSSGSASVRFLTTEGTAQNGLDYRSTNGALAFADGEVSKTFTVPIFDDTLVEGPETVILGLYDATGAALGLTNAILTILADEAIFEFAQTNFVVSETNFNAVITVLRLNGGTGPTSVNFFTVDGSATNALDYVATNGTLSFAPGQMTGTFVVPILNDAIGEGDEFLGLGLANPTGEAVLGTNRTATLTILDDDISFRFENPNYLVSEIAGNVNVQVFRIGLTNGVVSVNFATSDGTATAGADYSFTSRRIVFADGQTTAVVTIPIIDDLLGEGNEFFYLNLDSPTNGTSLAEPSQAVMTIVDNEDTLSFAATGYAVDEGASNVVVAVRRLGGGTGFITVSYATSNGTATAGLDYTNASGVLSFSVFETEKYITIPIINDTVPENDETFTVHLSNASGSAAVVAPSNTVVTILDNDTVVQFASATNSVPEDRGPGVVNITRVGGSSTVVRVDYSSSDGTATAGTDYTPVSGTLVFLPGQTNEFIAVPIIDDLVIEGDETIGLHLANVANAVLGIRSNTALTIVDNDASILTNSGVSIVQESLSPPNGIIDVNETVTVNFGLRNIGNIDTASLVATLLSTNGVSPLNPASQNYGVVPAGGNTVSRPFRFQAVGTNGARITATLRLQDGPRDLGTVFFPFILGRGTVTYTNTGAITIISPTNGTPALPYPSTIAVAGVTGTVSKVTVTLFNMSHTYPSDVDIMLVAPGGGRMVLMSDAGSSFAVNNVTLNFDDAASAGLPFSASIVSGSYRPTNYISADSWPSPAPGGPYATALSVFNGANPNGEWSLYVVDDTEADQGNIAGGWSLTFTISDIITPAADLVVRVNDAPDPVMPGVDLIYTITVTNFGPATATGVVLTNLLPAGVTFVSSGSSQGSCNAAGPVLTCNLGTLNSGASATVTVVARPTQPGLITDEAGVFGNEVDFSLGDNVHSAKTTVNALTITYGRQGDNLVLSWPVGVPGAAVECSDSLEPGSWVPLSVSPIESGGMYTVVIAPTGSRQFYRLRMP